MYKLSKIKLILLLILLTICTLPYFALAIESFNVEIELPASYQNVASGSEVWFTIKLLNLANTQRMDVTLNYDIVDSNGQSIVHNSKTVAIETQASFVADLKIPENTPAGEYNVNVVVSSSLGDSKASSALKVSSKKIDLTAYYIAAGVILLILIVFAIIKSKPLIEKLRLKMKIGRIVREKLRKN